MSDLSAARKFKVVPTWPECQLPFLVYPLQAYSIAVPVIAGSLETKRPLKPTSVRDDVRHKGASMGIAGLVGRNRTMVY
jgi:hypothetical protein